MEYKDVSFFTSYFSDLQGYKLLEEFKVDPDDDKKYVGKVERIGTIHPLVLHVSISRDFPYGKLMFYTESLFGYPHLIKDKEYGSWFCLNTPFAESAEGQLNLEVQRLEEWIARQMRDDLPAIIEDPNVITALRFANAYEWENPDEVQEFRKDAAVTFVGDGFSDPKTYKESKGKFHGIYTNDYRYYIVRNSKIGKDELPYVIVDELPDDLSIKDFYLLKDFYGWDEEMCKHLLPTITFSDKWRWNSSTMFQKEKKSVLLQSMQSILDKVSNDEELYLPTYGDDWHQGKGVLTRILSDQRAALLEIINKDLKELKEEAIEDDDEYDPWSHLVRSFDDEEYYAEEDYYNEVYPYELRRFALGIKEEESITWWIIETQNCQVKNETLSVDLSYKRVKLAKHIGLTLFPSQSQTVSETSYFGRASFSPEWKNKKIGVVGLGAIGSMLVESLSRSGVSIAGLWDTDVVEPGNVCRSAFNLNSLGDSKIDAVKRIIQSVNPYAKVNSIKTDGCWYGRGVITRNFVGGSFYGNVNYKNQAEAIKALDDIDLIFDCTGSNEMLHFLSYAVKDKEIVSLCITNHSSNLLCISNKDGNPFELRKAYLSKIEQDTKNYYLEGSGCYSPTFYASFCDISSLLNMAVRDVNRCMTERQPIPSAIYSYDNRGVVRETFEQYKVSGYDISIVIGSEVVMDAEDLIGGESQEIGYVFGYYSADGKTVMVTHVVDCENAERKLKDIFHLSQGLIDYIGDFCYSGPAVGSVTEYSRDCIAAKAADPSINTNNPLLITRNPDGSMDFYLYINNELVQCVKM